MNRRKVTELRPKDRRAALAVIRTAHDLYAASLARGMSPREALANVRRCGGGQVAAAVRR